MVTEDLQIKRANAEDAVLLSKMSADTFFDTFTGTCTAEDMQSFIEDYFNVGQIQKELSDADDFYFIGYLYGNAVGYMRLKEDVSEVEIIKKHKGIELKRIYVLKEYHSKKIGAQLMKFALDFAIQKEYELLWLGVWEHNERAKEFYKKFGFIDSGFKHPFPIGNTPQTDSWLFRFIEKK